SPLARADVLGQRGPPVSRGLRWNVEEDRGGGVERRVRCLVSEVVRRAILGLPEQLDRGLGSSVGWLGIPDDPGRTNQPGDVVRLVVASIQAVARMEVDRQSPLEARSLEPFLRKDLLFLRVDVAEEAPALPSTRLEDVGNDAGHEPGALQGEGDETVSPLQMIAEATHSGKRSLTRWDGIEVQARDSELRAVRSEGWVRQGLGEDRRERGLGLT